jgi:hypothetical protein
MIMSMPQSSFSASFFFAAASARTLRLEPFRAQNSLDSGGVLRHD